MSDAPPTSDTTVSSSIPESRRIGVLSLRDSKETKAILNAVQALGHDPVWIREANFRSWITDGTPRLVPDVDALLNRLLVTKSDRPLEDLQLAALYRGSVPVLNPPEAVQRAIHKYRAEVRLALAGIPVLDAYFARSPARFEGWSDRLPSEAVHKRTIGTNGHRMSVVGSGEAINPEIANERSFLQEFVDTGNGRCSDLRVYVVDGQVIGSMRRYAPEDDWRTNVALGGDVEDVTGDLDAEARHVATGATEALGLDYGGVDLIAVDGQWHVLEINATAGFKGLFSATGVSPAPHIARLAIERAGGTVDPSRVSELESTLDDSVPACEPTLERDDAGNRVLGYTTRVRVSGTAGVETVVSKADTGATRTSVDTTLAASVGAGPLVGTTDVRFGTRDEPETRPLVDLDVRVDGTWRTVTASVTDRSEMAYPLLLGRDVLESYTLDVSRRVEE